MQFQSLRMMALEESLPHLKRNAFQPSTMDVNSGKSVPVHYSLSFRPRLQEGHIGNHHAVCLFRKSTPPTPLVIHNDTVSPRHSQREADSPAGCSIQSKPLTMNHSMSDIVIVQVFQSQKAAASNLAYLVLSEAVAIQQVGINRSTYTVLHYNLIRNLSRQIHTHNSFSFANTSLQCRRNEQSNSTCKSLSNGQLPMCRICLAFWIVTSVLVRISRARNDSPKILFLTSNLRQTPRFQLP